jgi:hypothetical protein
MLSLRARAIGAGRVSPATISAIEIDAAATTPLSVSFARGGPAGVRTADAGVSARIICANSVAAFRVCFAGDRFCFK